MSDGVASLPALPALSVTLRIKPKSSPWPGGPYDQWCSMLAALTSHLGTQEVGPGVRTLNSPRGSDAQRGPSPGATDEAPFLLPAPAPPLMYSHPGACALLPTSPGAVQPQTFAPARPLPSSMGFTPSTRASHAPPPLDPAVCGSAALISDRGKTHSCASSLSVPADSAP